MEKHGIRKCSQCKSDKGVKEFDFTKTGKPYKTCNGCRTIRKLKINPEKPKPKPDINMFHCSTCKCSKTDDQFEETKKGKLLKTCIQCRSKKASKRMKFVDLSNMDITTETIEETAKKIKPRNPMPDAIFDEFEDHQFEEDHKTIFGSELIFYNQVRTKLTKKEYYKHIDNTMVIALRKGSEMKINFVIKKASDCPFNIYENIKPRNPMPDAIFDEFDDPNFVFDFTDLTGIKFLYFNQMNTRLTKPEYYKLLDDMAILRLG